ncbi:signal transduction histidine kinase [Thalassococcus sp. CAU 1522]|uniref:histidine kinase n=1 Tax=Thalassococcus arenae TaxID=2851652 RepID=A0ABS6N304_9RHOB|nr:histidine kinase dimerization/phosphoacceptor domain -containing protein [Thalassococcus arenae]MBV2358406.1 signal transduction histidine kinase [Thalassococcus arenae]
MSDRAKSHAPDDLAAKPRWSRSLITRIALLMTLAMLPLGLISVYQTRVVIEDARSLSSASLKARTLAAATRERELIEGALGAAKGLASVLPTLDDDLCRTALADFVSENPLYIFAAFTRPDGRMACSSTGAVRDFSGSDRFAAARDRPGPMVSVDTAGAVTGEHVVLASHSARRDGAFSGIVTLSIPYAAISALQGDPDAHKDFELASIDRTGNVVASSSTAELAPMFLPRDIPPAQLVDHADTTFLATAENGEDRHYAVALTLADSLVLVGSWPASAPLTDQSRLEGTVATAFPILMWLAGVGVALYGMQRLVIRHVAGLRSAMRRFALGERGAVPLSLDDAPEELNEAQRAFNRMALLISKAEARREKDLKDKEVLLREVHHRVKNNLQLIASIINMQARKSASEDVTQVLGRLQRRVRSMAVLHRALFNNPDQSTVDATELVRAVIDDASALAGKRHMVDLTLDDSKIDLVPDQAMPMSLLVAEILAERIDGADPAGPIRLTLEAVNDDRLRLTFDQAETPLPDRDTAAGDPLQAQLTMAFARQLNAEMETFSADGRSTTIVEFPRTVPAA